MQKPDTVPQYVWDQCDEEEREFLVNHEAMHWLTRALFNRLKEEKRNAS
jgi:hypothetical protein